MKLQPKFHGTTAFGCFRGPPGQWDRGLPLRRVLPRPSPLRSVSQAKLHEKLLTVNFLSFSDVYFLHCDVFGLNLSIMNANTMGPSAILRLNRIQLVSRIAKFICYGVFVYSIAFFLLGRTFFSGDSKGIWSTAMAPAFYTHLRSIFCEDGNGLLVMALIQIVLWIWYWKMTRLPHFKDHVRLTFLMALVQLLLWTGFWKMTQVMSRSQEWQSSNDAWHNWNVLYHISVCVWYWKLARLFRFYERGLIFAAEAIRTIRILGLLCVVGWALGLVGRFSNPPVFYQQAPLPQGVVLGSHVTQSDSATNEYFVSHRQPAGVRIQHVTQRVFISGFFAFDFGTSYNFGPLFIGLILILIAWIMDEGRKIQEEQELTV
jgi:hypothetical protein